MVDRALDSSRASRVDNDVDTDSRSTNEPMLKAAGYAAKHSFSNLKREPNVECKTESCCKTQYQGGGIVCQE